MLAFGLVLALVGVANAAPDYEFLCDTSSLVNMSGQSNWAAQWTDNWQMTTADICSPVNNGESGNNDAWAAAEPTRNHIIQSGSGKAWSNLKFQATAKVTSVDEDAWGMTFRYIDTNNFLLFACTKEQIPTGTGSAINVVNANQCLLQQVVAGTATTLGTAYSFTWTQGTANTWTIVADGANVSVFQDAIPAAVISTTSAAIPSTAGKIGLYSYAQPDVDFDNIRVWADKDGDHVFADTDCDDNNAAVTLLTWFVDGDDDGYGDPASVTTNTCAPGDGWALNNTDCDDDDAAINPTTDWFADVDTDGFGDPAVTQADVCAQPEGFVLNSLDCDDDDITLNPETTWYPDEDVDDFGSNTGTTDQCLKPLGSWARVGDDCDDTDALLNPKTDWYKDEDEDGFGDPSDATVDTCVDPGPQWVLDNTDCDDDDIALNPQTDWYNDDDQDGFGDPGEVVLNVCVAPAGHVLTNTDCDDTDETINPNTDWYLDSDHDGYGNVEITILNTCAQPLGYVLDGTDCRDDVGLINPATQWSIDADGDDYGADGSTPSAPSCSAPAMTGWAPQQGDCDDLDDRFNPDSDWYTDLDEDGWGSESGVLVLADSCTPPTGMGPAGEGNIDCNDNNPEINPDTSWYIDGDGDGFGDETTDPVSTETCEPGIEGLAPNGLDCDDEDPDLSPNTLWFDDLDGDSYGATGDGEASCDPPAGTSTLDDTDCDDTDPEVNPESNWYYDHDGDGFGTGFGVNVCVQPADDMVLYDGDCDEQDPLKNPATVWLPDGDGDGFGDDLATPGDPTCQPPAVDGWTYTPGDCDDTDEALNPDTDWFADGDHDGYGDGAPENLGCDDPGEDWSLNDLDCDDTNEEINPDTIWYADRDGDQFGGDQPAPFEGCDPPASSVPWVRVGGDCDDVPGDKKPAGQIDGALIHPNAAEVCNHVDDDCDELIDSADDNLDDDTQDYFVDADHDGFGAEGSQAVPACFLEEGFSTNSDDCDDSRTLVRPGAPELCDSLDNDCNDQVDDAVVDVTWYVDSDEDGDGNPSISETTCDDLGEGWSLTNTDCDDDDDQRAGTLPEFCDGIDNNCDDEVDLNPEDGTLFFEDNDNDGAGNPASPITACGLVPPGGAADNGDDCDDGNYDINPGAIEHCDGVDENCNFLTDEDAEDPSPWYPDADGDGYGISSQDVQLACLPPDGYGEGTDDCDDENALVYVGAPELCDGIDNDCDELAEDTDDTGLDWEIWYTDSDGDGFGDGTTETSACEPPEDGVLVQGDCDDNNDAISPDAEEIPGDGIDQDCDTVDPSDEPSRIPPEDAEGTEDTGTTGDPAVGCGCDQGGTGGAVWLGAVAAVLLGRRRRREGQRAGIQ